jgi:hypothetical protein
MKVTSDPADLFASGYQPAQTYVLTVSLVGETLGTQYDGTPTCTEDTGEPYVQCNNNNFALEIDDARGPLQGGYCAGTPDASGACPSPSPTDDAWVAPDGDAVFGNRGHDPTNPATVLRNDPTSWTFRWTSPPAGTGSLTLYAALVDGNGGAGRADADQDPFGDDPTEARLTIREAGAPIEASSGGCSAGARAPLGGLGLLLALVALARLRRA